MQTTEGFSNKGVKWSLCWDIDVIWYEEEKNDWSVYLSLQKRIFPLLAKQFLDCKTKDSPPEIFSIFTVLYILLGQESMLVLERLTVKTMTFNLSANIPDIKIKNIHLPMQSQKLTAQYALSGNAERNHI